MGEDRRFRDRTRCHVGDRPFLIEDLLLRRAGVEDAVLADVAELLAQVVQQEVAVDPVDVAQLGRVAGRAADRREELAARWRSRGVGRLPAAFSDRPGQRPDIVRQGVAFLGRSGRAPWPWRPASAGLPPW